MIAIPQSELQSYPGILNAIPGHIGLKDLNSTYISGNASLARLIGFTHPHDLAGITDFDIKGRVAEIAPTFVQQDKAALEGNDVTNIDVHYYADDRLHMMISHKSKLYNQENELVGTIFHSTELQPEVMRQFWSLMTDNFQKRTIKNEFLKGSFSVNKMELDFKLTPRESECLFFLLRGRTAKEIARMLNLSEKTVWYYLEGVKLKLECHSRAELFDTCIENGLFHSIPFSLLQP